MKLSKYTRLGLLIVFSLSVLIWGLSYLKGNDIFKKSNYYHVEYNRIDGLVKSSKVSLNGYQVGQVSDIKFAPDNSGKLIVSLSVNTEFKIPKNSVARIISSDIMGTRAIELIFSNQNEFYQNNDTIPGSVEEDLKEQVSMQVLPLKSKAEELLSTVDSAITVLTVILNEDARDNLKASFTNFSQTMDNLERTTADLAELLSTEKDTIKNILSNVNELTAVFKANTENLETIMANLSSFSDTLSTISVTPMLANLTEASNQILVTLEKLNSDENSAGLLLNDDELYQSINALAENMAFLIGDIQQNPKRYLKFSAMDFGKEVYINTKDDASDKNIMFKVHLVSSKSKVDTKSDVFDGLKDVEEYFAGGVYSYLIGSTGIYSEIEEIHESVRKQFPESAIVAFKNGRLIKLEKALKQIR
ncbi:MlaD family protein [uncultured Draconibacterium sp.]|uniref:MlaD family protein n=1 Tax=uncultured Draconibacterium sp. TaxID=1573823 RepID=UPI003217AE32